MKMPSLLKNRLLIVLLGVLLTLSLALVAVWVYFLAHPISYVWVMDQGGDYQNNTQLVKMCSNGKLLWQLPFGQSGAIGYDPIRDIIWAPQLRDIDNIHYDQVVQVDGDGNVVDRIQGYPTNILAVDPNDGSVWVQKLIMIPNGPAEVLITKLAPNGKFLFAKRNILTPGYGIWAIALDPRDGTLWVGAFQKLLHLTSDGVLLSETSDAFFFSNGPHQIAVHPVTGEIWYTAGIMGGVYRMKWDGTLITRVFGFSDPTAVAIHPYDSSVWVANYDQPGTGSVTKVSPEGKILFDVKTPDHAAIVGINPYDGNVWAGYQGGILLLDQQGKLLDTLSGFNTPISFAFGQSTNKLEAIINCAIR